MSDPGAHDHGQPGNYEVIAHQRTVTGDVETIYWCKICGAYSIRQKYKDPDGEHDCVSNWIIPKVYLDVIAERQAKVNK